MSDDPSKTKQDRKRISLGEEHEVRYWTGKLGVSREELERAVKSVGTSADAVEDYFRQRGGKS